MAERKPKESDASLPFAALQLLAPPVRLVSAALWKVLKQRDVMQYGVVEGFVTSACEIVPGLLTVRHQAKLALGLRARLILELCRTQLDEKVITLHLARIRVPAALTTSSAQTANRDVKIVRTVESFHSMVQLLLRNPAERVHFFKEEFCVEYGPAFDQELEKLLWEFLIRLDQLLPVPSLAQTVSWLSNTPPVLEHCARAATQPQLLKLLLQHQACLGHLEAAASLPPNMGDAILTSLSLPLSGRVTSNHAAPGSSQTRDKSPFITPVFGLISNEDVPVMISAQKSALTADEPASSKDTEDESSKFRVVKKRQSTKEDGEEKVNEQKTKRNGGVKRKQPVQRECDSDDREEEEGEEVRRGAKVETETNKVCKREVLESTVSHPDVEVLLLPQDPSLSTALSSCLRYQPRVVIEKLSLTCDRPDGTSEGGTTASLTSEMGTPPVKFPTYRRTRNRLEMPDPTLDDKENLPLLRGISSSPSQPRSNTEEAEDYVADSEDEATKNFKDRLFMKRYSKTKHGTYIPTLREYWKPGMTTRRGLASTGSKRR